MEIFNSKRWVEITSSLIFVFCISSYSCSSTEELQSELNDEVTQTLQKDIITLSSGETILLQDTTT